MPNPTQGNHSEEAGIRQFILTGKNAEIPTESGRKGIWFPLTLCGKTRTIKLHPVVVILDGAGKFLLFPQNRPGIL